MLPYVPIFTPPLHCAEDAPQPPEFWLAAPPGEAGSPWGARCPKGFLHRGRSPLGRGHPHGVGARSCVHHQPKFGGLKLRTSPPAGSGPHFIVSAQLPSQQPSEEAAGGAEGFDLFKTLPGVQTSLFYCSSKRMNHGRCGKVTALFRAPGET